MRISLKLPRLSMNMEEGVIVQWHCQVGDSVKKGEPLYAVETEKASSDVEAPCDGVVVSILRTAGQPAQVGEHVCVLEAA